MDKEITMNQFKNIKSQILSSVDLSRKGSLDEKIVELVNKINEHNSLVTTSSCSGRITVTSKDKVDQKEGCIWVFSSHSTVNETEFIESVKNGSNLVVKFEPFILHIQCRTLEMAKTILTCALDSGYKNSGIVLGKHGKIIVAVRSTLNLEVPIAMSELLVDEKYLQFLVEIANQKMDKNQKDIIKFETVLSKVLSSGI